MMLITYAEQKKMKFRIHKKIKVDEGSQGTIYYKFKIIVKP